MLNLNDDQKKALKARGIILTNDGALIHSVISPSRHVEKRYEVTLSAPLPENAAETFAAGVVLGDGYRCLPARLFYSDGETRAAVAVHEGKFHQVKRMFAVLGSAVLTLKRTDIGALRLDPALEEGAYRPLSQAEIDALLFTES